MGRYTGPKARVNRALGALVYEEKGAVKAFQRRERPSGMHIRRRKLSAHGVALNEKQKLKHYCGLSEGQLRRLLDKARRQPGNTGEALLILCERRLDNVVRRAGLTATRPQARQAMVHGHLLVNGRKVDRPSYLVNAGDMVAVRKRPAVQTLYRAHLQEAPPEPLAWLQVDPEALQATVVALPDATDISLPVEVQRVIEIMSR